MKFLLSVIALCTLMIKAQQRILVLEKELIHKKKSSKVIGITRKSPNTNHKQLRNSGIGFLSELHFELCLPKTEEH